jgi:hypothetical protein
MKTISWAPIENWINDKPIYIESLRKDIDIPNFIDNESSLNKRYMIDGIANCKITQLSTGTPVSIGCMSSLCELHAGAHVNETPLNWEDFGEREDTSPKCGEYGCGNMQFEAFRKPKDGILEKYKITRDEYDEICDLLDCLSFGSCSWCS